MSLFFKTVESDSLFVFLLHCSFLDLFLVARPFVGLSFPIFSRHRDRRLPAF